MLGFANFMSVHLPIASWTLFSPKSKCSYSINGIIDSIGNVLLTAIILTLW